MSLVPGCPWVLGVSKSCGTWMSLVSLVPCPMCLGVLGASIVPCPWPQGVLGACMGACPWCLCMVSLHGASAGCPWCL